MYPRRMKFDLATQIEIFLRVQLVDDPMIRELEIRRHNVEQERPGRHSVLMFDCQIMQASTNLWRKS